MNTLNLGGLRVLNTRPLFQNQALQSAIEKAGGVSISCPAIAIEEAQSAWITRLPELRQIKLAIFISANAVRYFFNALQSRSLEWPSSVTILAVGEGTARELENFNMAVHATPEKPDSEHLLTLPELQDINNQTILLVKGEGGRTLIADTLNARKAYLIQVSVYKRTLPIVDPKLLETIWNNDAVDIILFTSEQAMVNVFTLFGDKAKDWISNKPCLVVSNRLAEIASSFGIKSILICRPDTIIDGLHQFTQGFFHATKQ